MLQNGQEKRIHERFKLEMPIMYSFSRDNQYCYFGGKIHNLSEGGLYFETNYELPPGSFLSIKKVSRSADTYDFETEDTEQMSVKWCKKFGVEGQAYFGVGVGHDVETTGDNAEKFSAMTDTLFDTQFNTSGFSKNRLKKIKEIAEKKAEKLEKLYHLITQVSSTLDLQEVLQSICKEMIQIFDSRNVGIGLLTEDRKKIRIAAFQSKGKNESDATGMELDINENIATLYVIKKGRAIVVPDVQKNPLTASYQDIAVIRGSHSLMLVPLKTRNKIIGTIGLPRSKSYPLFTSEEVTLAQEIGDRIAFAIDNAQLHTETEKARVFAEKELEIGRKIQASFLPDKMAIPAGWEIVSHFQAARHVAGDFFDLFRLESDQRIGIVIGDVCDKGVGAALYMALFRSLIRAFAIQSFNLKPKDGRQIRRPAPEILTQTITLTNNYIAQTHSQANMFATLFFGILDPKSGVLNYMNCGHMAPLVVAKNKIRIELEPTGPAVGMFPDAGFSVRKIRLQPNDILFAYTDGLTDAQNKAGIFFARKQLLELLTGPFKSAAGLLDTVRDQVNRHIAGTQQYDDIAILMLRRLAAVS